MEYFKINNANFSDYVSGLQVTHKKNYVSKTNAAGNTVIDYINTKRTITVNFIPCQPSMLARLFANLNLSQTLSISFMNPSAAISEVATATCFLAQSSIPYYSLNDFKTLTKGFTLTFQEL